MLTVDHNMHACILEFQMIGGNPCEPMHRSVKNRVTDSKGL